MSRYIAEFANTLSNFAYVYFALYPPSMPLTAKDAWKTANLTDRVKLLDLQSISLILVGVSSGAYHASMHALPQWLDESSMYLLAASWIYILLTTSYVRRHAKTSPDSHASQTPSIKRTNKTFVTLGLAASLGLSSLTSHLTGSLAVHSIVFAFLLILSGIKLIYFIFTATPSSESILKWPQARKTLLEKLAKAIFFLWLGFSLWLVDCNPTACQYLRDIRHAIIEISPLLRPLTWVLELHAWWHFFTARAAGEYISLVRYLTTEGRESPEAKLKE